MEAVIRHEIGEALEPSLKDAFPAVLERFPQTRLELWVRTLKDALADVNDWGRLAYIVAEERLPSLAVMLAWRPGLIPALLPELEPAFQDSPGHRRLGRHGRGPAPGPEPACGRWPPASTTLLEAPEAASPAWLQDELHRRYLAPLGL